MKRSIVVLSLLAATACVQDDPQAVDDATTLTESRAEIVTEDLGATHPGLAGGFAYDEIPGNKYPRKHTVYVNFEGLSLQTATSSNSALDQWTGDTFDVEPFGGSAQYHAQIALELEALLSPYGIRVTTQRPPDMLPYTMVVPWNGVSTLGPLGQYDCEDLDQRGLTVHRFGPGETAQTVARRLVKGAGMTWGLEFSADPASLMCDGACDEPSAQSWLPTCAGVSGACSLANGGCPAGQQNDHQVLRDLFGTDEPDDTPPIADITSPAPGLVVLPGSDLQLRAIVDDDFGGVGYRLTVTFDGEVLLDTVDFARERVVEPFTVGVDLTNVDEGTFVFIVEAMDHADHVTVDEVTVTVTPDAGDGSSGSTGSSDGADSTTSADSGAEEAGSTTDPTTGSAPETETAADSYEPTGEDGSCACRSSGGSPALAPLVLVGLGLGRRRRQRAPRHPDRR